MTGQRQSDTNNVVPLRAGEADGTSGSSGRATPQRDTTGQYEIEAKADSTSGPPGGGGGDLETRVSRLEFYVSEILSTLKDIVPYLARIDAKIDAQPSASEFGELRGRVNSMPTTWQLVLIFGAVLSGLFLIWKGFIEPNLANFSAS